MFPDQSRQVFHPTQNLDPAFLLGETLAQVILQPLLLADHHGHLHPLELQQALDRPMGFFSPGIDEIKDLLFQHPLFLGWDEIRPHGPSARHHLSRSGVLFLQFFSRSFVRHPEKVCRDPVPTRKILRLRHHSHPLKTGLTPVLHPLLQSKAHHRIKENHHLRPGLLQGQGHQPSELGPCRTSQSRFAGTTDPFLQFLPLGIPPPQSLLNPTQPPRHSTLPNLPHVHPHLAPRLLLQ